VADLSDLFEVGRDDQNRGAPFEHDIEQPVDFRLGADIDAVGAISSVAAAVPEPETYALFAAGLAALAFMRGRRKNKQA